MTETTSGLPSEQETIIDHRLYSKSKVAALLGIGKETISQLISEGEISYIMIGSSKKIPGTEIRKFLSEKLVRNEKSSPSKSEAIINDKQNLSEVITDDLFTKIKEETING